MSWENLDLETLFAQRDLDRMASEQTTSANVGSYPVPLGAPLRRSFPTTLAGYTPISELGLPDPVQAAIDSAAPEAFLVSPRPYRGIK